MKKSNNPKASQFCQQRQKCLDTFLMKQFKGFKERLKIKLFFLFKTSTAEVMEFLIIYESSKL